MNGDRIVARLKQLLPRHIRTHFFDFQNSERKIAAGNFSAPDLQFSVEVTEPVQLGLRAVFGLEMGDQGAFDPMPGQLPAPMVDRGRSDEQDHQDDGRQTH